jgi:beta-mannosidase
MPRTIDLRGPWQLSWNDGQRGDRVSTLHAKDAVPVTALNATVPGEVHDELVRHGLLADPRVGLNGLAARWVEEMFWLYRRTFRAPRLTAGERAWLVFEGLDLAAVVYLNGKEVGRHANAFLPCRLDVTQALAAGENVLVVQLESGLFHAADRSADGYGVTPDHRLTKRPWLRKSQCSHAWDWSPRLLNVGIHKPVRLEIARTARLDGVVALAEVSEDLATGKLTVRAFVEGLADKPGRATLDVTLAPSAIRGSPSAISVSADLKPGMNRLETDLTVERPALWWPVGHGRQPLYTVHATVRVGGRRIGATEKRIGFRRVRVNQDRHPDAGRYFVVEVNGKPIFVKGGNFVPADIVFASIERRRYAALVDRALEANFNFLRVWGGGLYESDEFYDLCDERGVLVWQEFGFACAKYPTVDEAFLADVKREATHHVRRLAHHPSLVIWCGNNEMEWGAWGWGYERGVALPDYALFHGVLPRILKLEDGTRYYQPSSPLSPDHEDPNAPLVGDQHPWNIGFADTDFRGYRNMVCRFPNEGGILGPTSLPTTLACLPEGHRRPHSFAWEIHDNSIALWQGRPYADRMLEQWLGKRVGDLSVEEFVYWAGVVQGEGLGEYVRNFRRRMFDCAAAVFWMYNDCWPATRSWTIVDFYLRRTPAFHPVRRAMAPLAVVVVRADDRVRVFGVNDGPEWRGSLRYGLFALAGARPLDESRPVTVPANASTPLAEFDARRWDRLGVRTHAAFALLADAAGREVARDRLMLPFFKEMRWPRARVSVTVRDGRAVFRSRTFAWRVCLDLDGERALPDNFFDVYPGIATVLDWPAALGAPVIRRIGNLT